MVDLVSRMTATLFVMRVATSETTSVDVTITGTGLKYDATTGMILAGEIGAISLSHYSGSATKQALVSIQQINNVDLDSATLAQTLGDKFWNNAQTVVDAFDKLTQLNPFSSLSYFSPTKSFAYGTDNDDAITGSKFSDEMHGQAGDDALFGGSGHDRIHGEAGDDLLSGVSGNDILIDVEGNNELYGGNHNDILRSGAGVDRLDGGKNDDILYTGGGYDWATGGDGRDQFVFSLKDSGKLNITDFTDADLLVNLSLGLREEGYRDFLDHAHQSGRNVVYDNGEMHVVLKNFKLANLHLDHFGDASSAADLLPYLG